MSTVLVVQLFVNQIARIYHIGVKVLNILAVNTNILAILTKSCAKSFFFVQNLNETKFSFSERDHKP